MGRRGNSETTSRDGVEINAPFATHMPIRGWIMDRATRDQLNIVHHQPNVSSSGTAPVEGRVRTPARDLPSDADLSLCRRHQRRR